MKYRGLPIGVVAAGLLLLLGPLATAASAAYVPKAGDVFHYRESITVTNGVGNYTGYTEAGYYNGSVTINSALPNGTVNASYASSGTYQNNQGVSYPWSEAGAFTFSDLTLHYLKGTDNQTGYTDPYVWFLVNTSLADGATFYVLNSQLTVVSHDATFATSTSSTGYAAAIFAEGNGTFQRDDSYGVFSASYNWKAYFDPTTGYALGYVYTESDSNGAGDGFTYTDTLTDTQTSFAVTSVAAPPPPGATSTPFPWTLVLGGVVLVVVVVAIAVVVARRRPRVRRHPIASGPANMPAYTPAPVRLIPSDQPAVQQVVVRETVKVPCAFCGTLMDSTATVCPQCGAPRR